MTKKIRVIVEEEDDYPATFSCHFSIRIYNQKYLELHGPPDHKDAQRLADCPVAMLVLEILKEDGVDSVCIFPHYFEVVIAKAFEVAAVLSEILTIIHYEIGELIDLDLSQLMDDFNVQKPFRLRLVEPSGLQA